jgi:GntR family transcriptional regulator, transcriptional repressor for pyruvate dehydrogenase complex
VAEAIRSWLAERGLGPGDPLPSERDLIRHFGMARGTVREALRLLKDEGLWRAGSGPDDGAGPGDVSEERARAVLSGYLASKDLTLADVFQLRRLLEPELAAELAGRLSGEVLDDLEAAIPDVGCARPPESARDRHLAALAFHARLAQEAENPLLGFLIGFLGQALEDTASCAAHPPESDLWRIGQDYQRRLVAALRRGDATAARRIMRDHIESSQHLMDATGPEQTRRLIAE